MAESLSVSRSSARTGGQGQRIGESDTLEVDDLSISLDNLDPDGSEDFWDVEQQFDSGKSQETINAGRSAADVEADENGEVEALKVDFQDGRYLFEQPHGLVWKLDKEGKSLSRRRVAAQALEAGDEVIVIKDDSRRDIFEHIVEKIHSESRGPFQDYLAMLDLWVTGIDRIVDTLQPTAEERKMLGIPEDMNVPKRDLASWIKDDLEEWSEANDTDVTRSASQIQQWLIKETLGPSSPEVIGALGKIYDVTSLESHSNQIFKGLEEVRSLHVRVGTNLSKILIGAHASDADDWLLEECGLRIGDVQEATAVKTVVAPPEEEQMVNSRKIGHLHYPNQ